MEPSPSDTPSDLPFTELSKHRLIPVADLRSELSLFSDLPHKDPIAFSRCWGGEVGAHIPRYGSQFRSTCLQMDDITPAAILTPHFSKVVEELIAKAVLETVDLDTEDAADHSVYTTDDDDDDDEDEDDDDDDAIDPFLAFHNRLMHSDSDDDSEDSIPDLAGTDGGDSIEPPP
ncbi:hypothetical protein BV898_10292 [Hypsibius exemplaris]|uniref:Uncharacterized protein n=1 Tax=Hypsibius exemplaris TaxID=2072580 RepID=A0A1W0WK48_HYPEX|nr:hypothetical protein BV898_10292 [Hypsibius exemplaris]